MTLKRVISQDRNLQLVQDNVDNAITKLQNSPISGFSGASFIQNAAIGTSQTPVAHKLGRTPVLWIVVGINANATIYSSQASDANYLYLTASAGCTGSFVVM